MKSYSCTLCGYVYNPYENDGIDFNNLDSDWVCPVCSAPKSEFEEIE